MSSSHGNHVFYPWRWWSHTKVWSHSLSDRRIHSNCANLRVSLSVLSQNRKEHSSTYQGFLVRTYSCRDFWRCRVHLLGGKCYSKSVQLKKKRIFKQLNSLFVGWFKDGLLKLTFINERSPDLSIRSSFSKEPVSFKLVISYNHQKYFRSRAENEKLGKLKNDMTKAYWPVKV